MRRTVAVAVLLLLGGGPLQAQGRTLRATFLGNAAFEITDGQTTILTDFPYRSGAFHYMEYDPARLGPRANSLCLFSHAHADHFAADLLDRIGCTVAGPESLLKAVKSRPKLPLAPHIVFSQVSIAPIPTPHNDVEHFSYLIEWNGVRLYVAGDTENTAALEKQTQLDALFINPWLYKVAHAAGTMPAAKQIILVHLRPGEKLPECPACVVPAQGQVFVLGGASKVRAAIAGERP